MIMIQQKIETERQKQNISKKQFCKAVNMNTNSYSKFVNGDFDPRLSTILKMLKILSININF